jgi:hypothetical protein
LKYLLNPLEQKLHPIPSNFSILIPVTLFLLRIDVDLINLAHAQAV